MVCHGNGGAAGRTSVRYVREGEERESLGSREAPPEYSQSRFYIPLFIGSSIYIHVSEFYHALTVLTVLTNLELTILCTCLIDLFTHAEYNNHVT